MVQTWGPQGPSLTAGNQQSPGSNPPSSQEKPCPPSRCQSPAQIPVLVAEWPKVPCSQVKYSAMLGARECPALCANSVPEAKGNPGNSLPRLPGPCLHLLVIHGSSQHPCGGSDAGCLLGGGAFWGLSTHLANHNLGCHLGTSPPLSAPEPGWMRTGLGMT